MVFSFRVLMELEAKIKEEFLEQIIEQKQFLETS
jgi:hypothetical protein